MIISICGLPGAGKTTIGKELAAKLQFSFVDLDDEIEAKHGPITILFKESESHFRHVEREVLIHTLKKSSQQNVVLALGGGTPVYQNNMDLILASSLCIYVIQSIDQCISHIKGDHAQRPLMMKNLSDAEMRVKFRGMLALRDPFYRRSQLQFPLNTGQPTVLLTNRLKLLTNM